MPVHFGTLDFKLPLMFVDGMSVYDKFAREHVPHKKGYFIMAPSGAGKTYFITHQKEKHWMDGDFLWEDTNAHPKGFWWLESYEVMDEIDQKSDVITTQAKRMGFWIIGASNNWLTPDAIVLPPWSTHKRYIMSREKEDYDGGATSDRLPGVLNHRRWIRKWTKKGVPCFKSVQEATDYLAAKYKSEFGES